MQVLSKGMVVCLSYHKQVYQGVVSEVREGGREIKVRFVDSQQQRREVWRLASEVKVVAR